MITLKQILELRTGEIISYEGGEALEKVRENGYNLRFVHKQTPEICLEAVNEDGDALKYVKEQTPEICLAAVKQYGNALQFVREQTPEICLAAVKEEEDALQSVDKSIFKEEKTMITLELTEEQIEQVKKIINN